MKSQESIAAWFEELERCGENTQIVIGLMNPRTGAKTEVNYPHGSYDGVYALHRLMIEQGTALDREKWKIKNRKFPPVWIAAPAGH
jgi:hypothetical protein